MKHRVAGRKLGRTSAHRLALLRNLSTALFASERIKTTLGKAKELRPFAERLITLSRRETLHARRRVARHIRDRKVVAKLFDTLSARYAQRPGGYTRIIRLGPRRGDGAEMALVELLGGEAAPAPEAKSARKGRRGAAAPAPEPEAAQPAKEKARRKTTARRAAGEHKKERKKETKAAEPAKRKSRVDRGTAGARPRRKGRTGSEGD